MLRSNISVDFELRMLPTSQFAIRPGPPVIIIAGAGKRQAAAWSLQLLCRKPRVRVTFNVKHVTWFRRCNVTRSTFHGRMVFDKAVMGS